jgi:hypothetical protein
MAARNRALGIVDEMGPPKKVLAVKDIPETLLIFGNEIRIVASSDPTFWGQWDPVARVIELDQGLVGCHLMEILIHEAMHALYSWTSLDGQHGEERTVSTLAVGIVTIMGENPWLAKLLADFSPSRNIPRQMELLAWASFGKGLCCKRDADGIDDEKRDRSALNAQG